MFYLGHDYVCAWHVPPNYFSHKYNVFDPLLKMMLGTNFNGDKISYNLYCIDQDHVGKTKQTNKQKQIKNKQQKQNKDKSNAKRWL